MTATASSPGTSPPPLPPSPSSPHKPMPRRGDCLWGVGSCFGGSPVADSDAGHHVDHRGRRSSSWLTWSNFRRKKKKNQTTVLPVEASPAGELAAPGKKAAGDIDRGAPEAAGGVEKAAGGGRHVQNEVEKEGSTMKQHRRCTAASPAKKPAAAATESLGQIIRFFEKLRKVNKDKRGPTSPISGSHTDEVSKSDQRHRRPPPPQQQQIRLASLSVKYDARRGPAARTPPEPARTFPSRKGRTSAAAAACGTPPPSSPAAPPPRQYYSNTSPAHTAAASRLGCARSQKNTTSSELEPPLSLRSGRNDQLLGLSVMAVVLVMMVLFGRVSAVLFTCLWLYCLPRVRATMAEPEGATGSRSAAGVDLDSEEYKKKVVLEGLLRRHGRRSPGLQ